MNLLFQEPTMRFWEKIAEKEKTALLDPYYPPIKRTKQQKK